MKTLFTSDQHHNHHNIIAYCKRPFGINCSNCSDWNKDCKDCKALTLPHQTDQLVRLWNERVTDSDLVYNFGDYIWTEDVDLWVSITNRLNGRQRILVGNHDKLIADRNGVAKTIDQLPDQISNLIKNGKIEWIKNYYEEKINGQWVVMNHFPLSSWHRQMYGSIHVHGHVHATAETSWPKSSRHGRIMDVGVDCHNYAPVSFEEIKRIMDSCTNDLRKGFTDG